MGDLDWMNSSSSDSIANLIEHWRQARIQHQQIAASSTLSFSDSLSLSVNRASGPKESAEYPAIVLKAVITLGDKTKEGSLVIGVALPWLEIIREIERDPAFLYQVPWRKLEELIAGAYRREGWPEVVLTPPSGDFGRDIIASKPGIGSVRLIDQVKAYSPGHIVRADEVRAVLGVLDRDRNVSKGIVTTTSRFAPGIYEELKSYMPFRLELKDGEELERWLLSLKSD